MGNAPRSNPGAGLITAQRIFKIHIVSIRPDPAIEPIASAKRSGNLSLKRERGRKGEMLVLRRRIRGLASSSADRLCVLHLEHSRSSRDGRNIIFRTFPRVLRVIEKTLKRAAFFKIDRAEIPFSLWD